MDPVVDYEELIARLTRAFSYRYETLTSDAIRMVGIIFARPTSPWIARCFAPVDELV
jgi:hypothetical protein